MFNTAFYVLKNVSFRFPSSKLFAIMSKIHLCPLQSSHHRTLGKCGDSICGCSYCCTEDTTAQPHCWTKERPRRLFPRPQCSVSYDSRSTLLRLSAAETVHGLHTVQPHSRTAGIVESSFLTYSVISFYSSAQLALVIQSRSRIEQMSDGCKWMIEYHPWPWPSHDLPDSFLHLRPIAMDGTFLASGFFIAVTAAVKSAVGIIQQFLTTWT